MSAAVLLAACGVDEISVPVSEKYERDFIKTFGVVDKNQTWRLVEQQSVTVEAEEPSNVKVYVNVGGELYIVADYKNVQGTQTLTYSKAKSVSTSYTPSGSISINSFTPTGSVTTQLTPAGTITGKQTIMGQHTHTATFSGTEATVTVS